MHNAESRLGDREDTGVRDGMPWPAEEREEKKRVTLSRVTLVRNSGGQDQVLT